MYALIRISQRRKLRTPRFLFKIVNRCGAGASIPGPR
jgi:hypothetical protein